MTIRCFLTYSCHSVTNPLTAPIFINEIISKFNHAPFFGFLELTKLMRLLKKSMKHCKSVSPDMFNIQRVDEDETLKEPSISCYQFEG